MDAIDALDELDSIHVYWVNLRSIQSFAYDQMNGIMKRIKVQEIWVQRAKLEATHLSVIGRLSDSISLPAVSTFIFIIMNMIALFPKLIGTSMLRNRDPIETQLFMK